LEVPVKLNRNKNVSVKKYENYITVANYVIIDLGKKADWKAARNKSFQLDIKLKAQNLIALLCISVIKLAISS